jgi:hypothetical protein
MRGAAGFEAHPQCLPLPIVFGGGDAARFLENKARADFRPPMRENEGFDILQEPWSENTAQKLASGAKSHR